MLSKESKQVIIKQLKKGIERHKDASKYSLSNNPEMVASNIKQILSLEKALKELRDV